MNCNNIPHIINLYYKDTLRYLFKMVYYTLDYYYQHYFYMINNLISYFKFSICYEIILHSLKIKN